MSEITSDKCTDYIDDFEDKKAALKIYQWTLNKLTRVRLRKQELDRQKNLSSVEVKLWHELNHEIEIRQLDHQEELARAINAIFGLSDITARRVLTQKYLDGATYSDIALNLGYSERQIIRIHNEAIKNIKIKTCHSD